MSTKLQSRRTHVQTRNLSEGPHELLWGEPLEAEPRKMSDDEDWPLEEHREVWGRPELRAHNIRKGPEEADNILISFIK